MFSKSSENLRSAAESSIQDNQIRNIPITKTLLGVRLHDEGHVFFTKHFHLESEIRAQKQTECKEKNEYGRHRHGRNKSTV